MLRPVPDLDGEAEEAAVDDERAGLEEGPRVGIVQVRETHEIVDQTNHVSLVENQLLDEPDIVEGQSGLLTFRYQFAERLFVFLVLVAGKPGGAQRLHGAACLGIHPRLTCRKELLDGVPVGFREGIDLVSERGGEDRFAQLGELRLVDRVHITFERERTFGVRPRDGTRLEEFADGRGVRQVGRFQIGFPRLHVVERPLVEGRGTALREVLVYLGAEAGVECKSFLAGLTQRGYFGFTCPLRDYALCVPLEIGPAFLQELI